MLQAGKGFVNAIRDFSAPFQDAIHSVFSLFVALGTNHLPNNARSALPLVDFM
jgi:hypothetical protein